MKQRLIGAAVLVALAVIFLPMLVQGPAPDSGVADLSMQMPAEPGGGYETRDLPLVVPGATSSAGLLAGDRQSLPTVDTATATAPGDVADAAGPPPGPADAAGPGEASPPMLPASTAGGDHVVGFGAYATRADAETVAARLRAESLPAFVESASVGGRAAWRVRIGPYASRAEAEMARLAAGQPGPGVDARVITLDAGAGAPPVASTARPLPSAPAASASTPLPTATTVAAAPVALSPAGSPAPVPTPASDAQVAKPAAAANKPATTVAVPTAAATGSGFAVQLGAFGKRADADALRERLRTAGINAFTESVQTDGGTLTRVKAGPVLSRAEAEQLKSQVRGRFGIDGLVRAHP